MLPRPGSLSSVMSPPIARASRRLIARPRPVPAVVALRPGGTPRRSPRARSAAMPGPVSRTATVKRRLRSRRSPRPRPRPRRVNLSALPKRLTRIWRTRCRSSTTSAGRARRRCQAKPDPLLARPASGAGRRPTRRARADRTARASMVSLPASILDRSRISLISPSRSRPPRWTHPSDACLLRVQRPVDAREQRIGEAEDRVHRRSQLVAHAGQELATSPRSRVRARRSSRSSRRASARCSSNSVREALARVVEVAGELPNSSRFGHLDSLA